MPERFGPPDHDSEYPEYSESDGYGNERFAPSAGEAPKVRDRRKLSWRTKSSASEGVTVSPTTTAPPAAPYAPPSTQTPPPTQATEPQGVPASPYGAPPADHVPAGGYLAGASRRARKSGRNRMSRVLITAAAVIAVIVMLAVIGALTSGSGSPAPGGGTGSGSTPAPQPLPSPAVTPAPANPASFEEAIVEFDEFTINGNGDRTFDLPSGITNGVVDIAYNGNGYFNLTAYNQNGDYHSGIFWSSSASGNVRATSVFGTYDYDGDYAESFEVSASGDWQLTLRPLSTLEELPDTYSSTSSHAAAFYYSGEGETVEIVFESSDDSYPYFTLNQEDLIDFPESIVRLTRTATITIALDPGPNIVIIQPDGATSWSITKQ